MGLLNRILDEAFDRPGWHGPNLRGSLRGVTVKQALWRPARGRHNIWELVLHTAYWKWVVRRRITGDRALEFHRAGSNWPRLPNAPNVAAWREDLAALERAHRELRRLASRVTEPRFVRMIYGIAAHDVYHAGQIGLIKRLRKSR